MKTSKTQLASRLAYTVGEVLESGVFPTLNSYYRAVARGDIATWKEGRRRMTSATSLHQYVERKTREAEAGAARAAADADERSRQWHARRSKQKSGG